MVSAAVNTGIHYGAAACRKITRVFSVPKPRVLVSESGGVYLQQIVDQTVNDVLTNSELCCPNEMIHWHCLSTEIALQAMVTSHLHDFPVEVSDFTESFVAQYHWELPFEWNLLHWLNTVSYTVYESIPYIDINLETIAAAPMLLITGAEQTHILIFNHPAEEPGDEISMIHDLVSGEEITVPYDELLDLVEDLLGDSVEYTVIVAEGIQNEATDDSDLTGSL